jgi:hypothetical protein
MEKLWTDEVIIEPVWINFMSKLLGEWEGAILWVRVPRVIGSLDSRDSNPVDIDVNNLRRVSCYPRRCPIKSQRVKHNGSQSSVYFHIFFTDRELPLSRS